MKFKESINLTIFFIMAVPFTSCAHDLTGEERRPAPQEFEVSEWIEGKPIHVNLGNGATAELSISGSELSISSGPGTHVITTNIFVIPDGRTGAPSAVIGKDVNFDGTLDLLVKVSDSASNPCYKIMMADTPSQQGRPEETTSFSESELTVCNPHLKPEEREIVSVERYGPLSRTEVYSVTDANEIKLSMIVEDIDYDFSRVSINAGDILDSFISIRGGRKEAYGCITTKSYLYETPDSDTATTMYLIPDDKVTIKDVKRVRGDEWAEVSYPSSTRGLIRAWVERPSVRPLNELDAPCDAPVADNPITN